MLRKGNSGIETSFGSSPRKFEFVDASIPLLAFNQQSGVFDVNAEGLEFFRALQAPIAVAGVAGLYRTGKSYLLNRVLLDRPDGFGVGPTVNPCTKGLWVWGRPLQGTTPDGEPCSIVIMDSEGIGALDEDADHDSRIFALVILLSSIFLYNSVGAIDENALQNLSLVVNLTKHIHVKSNQADEDFHDYAAYFPSFIWILRDFALQLKDEDGVALSPKEYLEKTLQQQKGFSGSIEDKNRVRRLLKEFFKERDCCTLVRPVVSESNLQNLAAIDMKDLRTEFVEQVTDLRRKVLGRARVKCLNGRPLNGDMIADMIESYIYAINHGAAPNIEQTWTYICKNECAKALKDAEDTYDKLVLKNVVVRLPVNPIELKDLHKQAKTAALSQFKQQAVGEDKERLIQELCERIAEKYSAVKSDNEIEAQRKSVLFLNENYASVEGKLRRGEFALFLDYEREMRAFQKFFIEHGPDGPNRKEIILEFVQSKSSAAADAFIKNSTHEMDLKEQLSGQKIQRLEAEIAEKKEDFLHEKEEWQRKLSNAESEKTQLAIKEQNMGAQLNNIKAEKEKVEKELREAVKAAREESGAMVEAANAKAWEFEERMKEMERTMFQSNSDFDQERELLAKKIKYLESTLEDTRKKEKEYLGDMKSQKKDHSSALKDIQLKYESQVKSLQSRVEVETERVHELERDLEEKEAQVEKEKTIWEEEELKLRSNLEDYKTQLETVKLKLERKENDLKKKILEANKEADQSSGKLKNKLNMVEEKLKEKEEALKQMQASTQKEIAVLTQNLEFASAQAEELRTQIDEERVAHANLLKTLQATAGGSAREEVEVQLEKLKNKYIQDIKKLETEHEESRSKLASQLDTYKQKHNEIELKYTVDTADLTNSVNSLTEKLGIVTEERNKLQNQLNSSELRNSKFQEETEATLKKKLKALEETLEEQTQRHQSELSESSRKAEETYQQLRSFYEAEKQRIEARLVEDKNRADKKYNAMCEELEDRIRQEAETYENELTAKEDEIHDLEAYYTEEINHLKHQSGLDQQKIGALEKFSKEIKEQAETAAKSHTLALEQMQERANTERQSMSQKLETAVTDLASKERDLTTTTYQKDQLEVALSNKESELTDYKSQAARDKEILSQRLETVKDNYQSVSDEYTQKKSDFKRENALARQEIEFKEKRIGDLERALQDAEEKYSETLKALKDQSGQELNETIEKLTKDKEALEQKLEAKRKSSKEYATATSKQLNGLEKERAVLAEKLANLDAKKADMEARLMHEIESLQQKLKEAGETESNDMMSVHLDNERLKTLLQEMGKELNDKNAGYERERMLWENKFNFLVQQRDQARSDYVDAQKKFDVTLEQLQKRGISDKERIEGATSSLISSMEARYINQIKDLNEAHGLAIEELQTKNKNQEGEIRTLRENLELERRKRNTDSGSLEKKLNELSETENRLLNEIDLIKRDRDAKLEEIKESLTYEKDQLKSKMNEFEKRAKEAENARAQMFLEHEKERAKWHLEKDHLVAQRNDAADAVERLEKKKEGLLRENEKLRADRMTRRNSGISKRTDNRLNTSGMSFEEFSKRSEDGDLRESSSTIASPHIPKRAVSPISRTLRRNRSGNINFIPPNN